MDVSQKNENAGSEADSSGALPMHGDDLVRSLTALTGLPDSSLRSELVDILSLGKNVAASEQDLSSLSLDDLRASMLVYLESIHADMMSKESNGSTDVTEA
ncbi:MAG: hypothetical protein RJB38_907 [Pseudomonadota bacterium]|jgi:hypothetical protein